MGDGRDLATLLGADLYVALLLLAPWLVRWTAELAQPHDERRPITPPYLQAAGGFVAIVMLIGAQLSTGSRTGLALTIAVLLGIYLMSLRQRLGSSKVAGRLLLSAASLAVVFAAQFALYTILERLGADPLKDGRIPFARNTIEAARAYLPFGSGVGTFVPVYQQFEKPRDATASYANHAHNDALQLLLEAGLPGLVVAGAFFVWFALRAAVAWRRRSDGDLPSIDAGIAQAATLAVLMLLIHSLFDYPLRTAALMSVFAFACGLLVPPLDASVTGAGTGFAKTRGRKHRPRLQAPATQPRPVWPDHRKP